MEGSHTTKNTASDDDFLNIYMAVAEMPPTELSIKTFSAMTLCIMILCVTFK